MPTKLSESFTLEELVFSQTAAREGIDNSPNSEQKEALRSLCMQVLQPLRDGIGAPLVVTSGFRSPRLNMAVHGAVDSQHMGGKAADLVCFSMSTKALLKGVLEPMALT